MHEMVVHERCPGVHGFLKPKKCVKRGLRIFVNFAPRTPCRLLGKTGTIRASTSTIYLEFDRVGNLKRQFYSDLHGRRRLSCFLTSHSLKAILLLLFPPLPIQLRHGGRRFYTIMPSSRLELLCSRCGLVMPPFIIDARCTPVGREHPPLSSSILFRWEFQPQ